MSDGIRVTSNVEVSGPFFTRNPGKTLRANVRDLMDALAEQADRDIEQVVDAHVKPMPGYVRGRTSSLQGKRWGTWARVAPTTAGLGKPAAIRMMAILAGRHQGNHGTTVGIEKQWHPYRAARSNVYRARALLTADLTRGLD